MSSMALDTELFMLRQQSLDFDRRQGIIEDALRMEQIQPMLRDELMDTLMRLNTEQERLNRRIHRVNAILLRKKK